jgi:hypothetical protein
LRQNKKVKRFTKQRGSVSLEALISLQLLFLLLVVSWSIAQIIYEYSMANSAAQAAAQAAVQEFDRSAPTRCVAAGDDANTSLCQAALARSQDLAKELVSSNFCNNPARLSGRGECITEDPPDVSVRCRSVKEDANLEEIEEAEDITSGPPNWRDCIQSSEVKIVVIRARVSKKLRFSGIAFFDVVPDVRVRSDAFAWRALEDEE